MKKKTYITPTTNMIKLSATNHLMAGSVKNNVGLKDGGAGSGQAKSRFSDWDDEDEW